MSKRYIYYFDAGNTRLKLWACCMDGKLVAEASLAHEGNLALALTRLPAEFATQPEAVLGASVLSPLQEQQFGQACQAAWAHAPQFAYSRLEQCGIRNAYGEHAAMLGIDRWLVMIGYDRGSLVSDGVACIVDCGTAVTIDLLRADGCHLGGYIVPGLQMMQNALQSHTARVRHDQSELEGISPGRSTAEAVMHGALLMLGSSLEKIVRQHGASLVLTGGDARRLGRILDVEYCDEPHLLLKGLQRYFADAGIS